MVQAALADPASVHGLLVLNTGGYFVPEEWNSPAALKAVLPSSGGVGNAHAIAAMFHAIAHDRAVGRVSFSHEDVMRMGAVDAAASEDALTFAPSRWSLGFVKSAAARPSDDKPACGVIMSEDAFGCVGLGGSVAFADPRADLSFGYVMNQMDPAVPLGERAQSLIDAVYRTLGYRRASWGRWIKDSELESRRRASASKRPPMRHGAPSPGLSGNLRLVHDGASQQPR